MFNIQKLEEKLFKLFVVGVGAALLIPIVYIKNILRPYIIGKMIPFQTIALIIAIIWIILLSIDWKKYKPKINFLIGATTIFVLIIFLSSVFGLDFYRSFWGNGERMEGFLALFHFFILLIATHSVLKNKPEIFKKLIFFSLAVSFFAAIYPALQKLGIAFTPPNENFDRPPGSFGNPAFLSGYLLVHLFLGGWYLLQNWAKGKKITPTNILTAIFLLGNFIGLIWTQTRGSWVGLILAIFTFMVISLFVFPKKAKIISGIILIIIIGSGSLFLIFQKQIAQNEFVKNTPVLSRLARISLDDGNTRKRLVTWQWGLDWFQQRPVLGVGQDMFFSVFDSNYTPDNYKVMADRFDRSHNKFIDVLVMNGVLGLFSYLILFFAIFWVISKKIRSLDNNLEKASWMMIISLFISYIAHIFFVFETPGNSVIFFFLIAWISILGIKGGVKEGDNQKKSVKIYNNQNTIIIFSAISIILGSLIFYSVNYKPYKAAWLTFRAASENPLEIDKIFSYHQQALGQNTFLNSEVRKMKGDHFLNFIIYIQRNNVDLKGQSLRNYSIAIADEMEKAIEEEEMIDFFVYPATTFAQLSWLDGISEEDKQYYLSQMDYWFGRLKEKWPLRTDFYSTLAESLFFTEEFEESERLIDEVLEITPKFGRPIWLKGLLMIGRGEVDSGIDKLFESIINGYAISDTRGATTFPVLMKSIRPEDVVAFLSLIDNAYDKYKGRAGDDYTLSRMAEFGAETHMSLNSSNIARAVEYLETYLNYDKNRAEYWAKIASGYAKLRNKEMAILSARRAMELDPENFGEGGESFIEIVENERWDLLP